MGVSKYVSENRYCRIANCCLHYSNNMPMSLWVGPLVWVGWCQIVSPWLGYRYHRYVTSDYTDSDYLYRHMSLNQTLTNL